MKIMILGTEYKVTKRKESEDVKLCDCDGYADFTTKEIVLREFSEKEKNEPQSVCDLTVYQKKVLRHEIVHSFLNESGLRECTTWARNEEIVDWIAIQFWKMADAMIDGENYLDRQ